MKPVDLATIITIILSIIAVSISAVDTLQYFNKPNLIYDVNSQQFIDNEFDSEVSIFIWNEGYTKADNITIYIQTNGKIKDLLILKGEMGKGTRFNLPVSNIKRMNDEYYILIIPSIVQGMEYEMHLLVNCTGNRPIDDVMVESVNGGVAREYGKNIIYRNIYYSIPVFAFILIFIIYIRRRHNKTV